jgi:hypothetical protein
MRTAHEASMGLLAWVAADRASAAPPVAVDAFFGYCWGEHG